MIDPLFAGSTGAVFSLFVVVSGEERFLALIAGVCDSGIPFKSTDAQPTSKQSSYVLSAPSAS